MHVKGGIQNKLKSDEHENKEKKRGLHNQSSELFLEKWAQMKNGTGSWRVILKPETESRICGTQEQALWTKYAKCKMDCTTDNEKYKICCDKRDKYGMLSVNAQREYKRRYDNVERMMY